MIYLFDEEPSELFGGFFSKRTLLAFDFDGTLAPIVRARDAAEMRAATMNRFVRTCELYDCAVITGRSREDVTPRLGTAPVWRIVGNHGQETNATVVMNNTEIAEVARYLARELKGIDGVDIEDKQLSLAVHFRNAPHPKQALDVIQKAISNMPVRLRCVSGKSVINLVSVEAQNKGDALLALRSEAGAERVLYVGDDVTDEDVFELRQPSWLVTVRIGSFVHSDATYYLREQAEIDRLLDKLVQLAVEFRA